MYECIVKWGQLLELLNKYTWKALKLVIVYLFVNFFLLLVFGDFKTLNFNFSWGSFSWGSLAVICSFELFLRMSGFSCRRRVSDWGVERHQNDRCWSQWKTVGRRRHWSQDQHCPRRVQTKSAPLFLIFKFNIVLQQRSVVGCIVLKWPARHVLRSPSSLPCYNVYVVWYVLKRLVLSSVNLSTFLAFVFV